jgi:hypothetical protein
MAQSQEHKRLKTPRNPHRKGKRVVTIGDAGCLRRGIGGAHRLVPAAAAAQRCRVHVAHPHYESGRLMIEDEESKALKHGAGESGRRRGVKGEKNKRDQKFTGLAGY